MGTGSQVQLQPRQEMEEEEARRLGQHPWHACTHTSTDDGRLGFVGRWIDVLERGAREVDDDVMLHDAILSSCRLP
jgi:hypothetical protein